MWVKIEVRHMKEASSTLLRYISKKGQHVSKGVLSKFKLGLILRELIPTPFFATYKFELELLVTTELVMLELKPTA